MDDDGFDVSGRDDEDFSNPCPGCGDYMGIHAEPDDYCETCEEDYG